MKKGFTLAEVLITLAVIGVVAALTIPVLIQKYQKKQLYSQFMKTYNTISSVIDNAIAEYGETDTWKWAKYRYNNETFEDELVDEGDKPIENYILSQLKYVKKCDKASDCFGTGYTFLNGEDGSSEMYPDETLTNDLGDYDYDGAVTVILADGSVIEFADYGGGDIGIIFDTNGKKGPNVMGRDFFMMSYRAEDVRYNEPAGMHIDEWDPNGSYGNNCSPNTSDDWDSSEGCASRLLQEGAMNY